MSQPTSNGQYIVSHVKLQKKIIDPYDVKNVYRSTRNINRDIKHNQFNVAKTMYMDYNTKNIYWLCHEEEKIDENEQTIINAQTIINDNICETDERII